MKYSFENTETEQVKVIDLIGNILQTCFALARQAMDKDIAEAKARSEEAKARIEEAKVELAKTPYTNENS
jgi:predicted translin family RNA/ssDNA-binding protein